MTDTLPKAYPTRILTRERRIRGGYAERVSRVLSRLIGWAWVELNYRPHAYQARKVSGGRGKLRKVPSGSERTPPLASALDTPRNHSEGVSHAYPRAGTVDHYLTLVVSLRWPGAYATCDKDHGWQLHRDGEVRPLGRTHGESYGAVRALVAIGVVS